MAKLTGEEIVAIIRAGQEAGAASISCYGLSIIYQNSGEPEKLETTIQYLPNPSTETPSETSKLDKELDPDVLGILDPAAYEQRILEGDLA